MHPVVGLPQMRSFLPLRFTMLHFFAVAYFSTFRNNVHEFAGFSFVLRVLLGYIVMSDVSWKENERIKFS